MSPTITLKKATRIEGNAAVHIETDGDRVTAARFMVQDFRGFERFLQGRRTEAVPQLVSRICGLCSAAHQVASLTAIEDAMGVEVPESVTALRRVAVLGEWIASHAVSYFFLTQPDVAGDGNGLFDRLRADPASVADALALRSAGQRIVRRIGGRAVHPVSLTLGGFSKTMTTEDLAEVREAAADAGQRARRLAEAASDLRLEDAGALFPRGQRVNHLAFDAAAADSGAFVALGADGERIAAFPPAEFPSQVSEMRADWSFAKFPYLTSLGFPAGITLVGPLARSHVAGGPLDSPHVADLELAQRVCALDVRGIDVCDVLRLLEIVWAAGEIARLLDLVDPARLSADADARGSGHGIGVVEAPRGVLVHEYAVESGCIASVRLLVATQFNNAFINMLLKDLAQAHVSGGVVSEEGERLIGRAIRLLDPCLSCATH